MIPVEIVLFSLALLVATTWFTGRPAWLSPGAAVALLVLAALGRWLLARLSAIGESRDGRPLLALPHAETFACLLLAVAYRLPALLHPWGWVNRDGAYGAFVALHLLAGERPAPVFTEGANYQGTLKAHLAALVGLVTRAEDLSWLMVVSTTLLYLVFLAAAMALARRLGGRVAAVVTGLYLALSPRFVTVFSLNCTGQYVDILALGLLALALTARILDEDPQGRDGRWPLLGVGLCCGMALWQQPAALPVVVVALGGLILRGATWRTPFSLYALAGLFLGILPAILWNLDHGWATSAQVAYNPVDTLRRVSLVPDLASKTVSLAFPLLAGVAHGDLVTRPHLSLALGWLYPLLVALYLVLERRPILRGIREARLHPSLLPPLLFAATVLIVWNYASGSAYSRPRYLLPATAAFAVVLGVTVARALGASRVVGAVALAGFVGLVSLNVTGTLPRLAKSRLVASSFEPLLRSLREKGIRTGYADFSLSAPVTMFTREAITFSASLGPTPAYHSPIHERRVREHGPDAYVLLPSQDIPAFRAILDRLGASYQFDPDPYPTFYRFSRRVHLEEVIGARSGTSPEDGEE